MSIVNITDDGYGPPHVTFRVSADDYDDAATAAKAEARAIGWRTKTRGSVLQVESGEWDVVLAAWPPALPEGVLFAGTVGEFLDELGA